MNSGLMSCHTNLWRLIAPLTLYQKRRGLRTIYNMFTTWEPTTRGWANLWPKKKQVEIDGIHKKPFNFINSVATVNAVQYWTINCKLGVKLLNEAVIYLFHLCFFPKFEFFFIFPLRSSMVLKTFLKISDIHNHLQTVSFTYFKF